MAAPMGVVKTTGSPAGTRRMAAPMGVVKAMAIIVRTTGSPAVTRSMAALMGAVKAMAITIIVKTTGSLASAGDSTLNREATVHAQWQLADA